jgi:hypothetical protein
MMKTTMQDEYGNRWTYEQEQGMSLFRHRETKELRQGTAGAQPPGRGWDMINNVPAIIPIEAPPPPPDTSTLPLSQRIAKEMALFPPTQLACLVELAKRVEVIEAVTGL